MNVQLDTRSLLGLRMGSLCLAFFVVGCGEFTPPHDLQTSRDGICVPLADGGWECTGEDDDGFPQQGPVLNGLEENGAALGATSLDGASLNDRALINLRVEAGELLAEQDGAVLRGEALAGATLLGRWNDEVVPHRILSVQRELPTRDHKAEGLTYLYEVEVREPATGEWKPVCAPDADGNAVAIPVKGVWNTTGDRADSTTEFTFACTSGAIGKCYRWGYRPWANGGSAVARDAHQACTRMARADYCGDGTPHTREGTRIVIWDDLPSQVHPPEYHLGFEFEAAWSPSGAACLSHLRWKELGQTSIQCNNGQVLSLSVNPKSLCESPNAATAVLFNASRLK